MVEKKKRLCLFAGFDAHSEIADYVTYYLRALSQIADVYYWGDFKAPDTEKAKIESYCKAVYCQRHGKYDFGSWQELINKIGREKIEAYDELILANDSCYGPLFDLKDLFNEMNSRDCDFWGLSTAYRSHVHLQSYFLVFKRPVIKSNLFYDFFNQVKPETKYNDVCANYEDRFTYTLNKAGFRFSSYIEYSDVKHHPYQDVVAAIKERHFPFLKVKFFLGGIRDQAGVADWRQVINEYTDYPVKLIEEDLKRRGFDLDIIDQAVQEKQSETPNFYPKNSPPKRIVKKIAKTLLSPVIYILDKYFDKRVVSYAYKLNRLYRSHSELQQKYNALRSQVDKDFTSNSFQIVNADQACSLKVSDRDVLTIGHFDLEFPLTSGSNVLLIGNISIYNLASLELYNSQVSFLNNDWSEILHVKNEYTDDLCNFNFVNKTGEKVYFDFILVQPLQVGASNKEIKHFIVNLKNQLIFESVLIMLVSDAEEGRYRQILESENFRPAISEHGLVVIGDPFQIYYDKIKCIKGYKALIYKIK